MLALKSGEGLVLTLNEYKNPFALTIGNLKFRTNPVHPEFTNLNLRVPSKVETSSQISSDAVDVETEEQAIPSKRAADSRVSEST